jgi:hypothetical protein
MEYAELCMDMRLGNIRYSGMSASWKVASATYALSASRPLWCGECRQAHRMLGFDGAAPRPCPHCKPSAVVSNEVRFDTGSLALHAIENVF